MLDTSLEMFAQQVKEADTDKNTEKAYYDKKAEDLRNVESESAEAKNMLSELEIPATIENIEAAVNYIENSYSPLKESYKRKNVLDDDEQAEFDEVIDSVQMHLVLKKVFRKNANKPKNIWKIY